MCELGRCWARAKWASGAGEASHLARKWDHRKGGNQCTEPPSSCATRPILPRTADCGAGAATSCPTCGQRAARRVARPEIASPSLRQHEQTAANDREVRGRRSLQVCETRSNVMLKSENSKVQCARAEIPHPLRQRSASTCTLSSSRGSGFSQRRRHEGDSAQLAWAVKSDILCQLRQFATGPSGPPRK